MFDLLFEPSKWFKPNIVYGNSKAFSTAETSLWQNSLVSLMSRVRTLVTAMRGYAPSRLCHVSEKKKNIAYGRNSSTTAGINKHGRQFVPRGLT